MLDCTAFHGSGGLREVLVIDLHAVMQFQRWRDRWERMNERRVIIRSPHRDGMSPEVKSRLFIRLTTKGKRARDGPGVSFGIVAGMMAIEVTVK